MAISIDYSRVPGYPQERISRESISVIDKIQCEWSDRITLAKELTGFVIGEILHKPHKYDAGDEPLNNIYCKSVSIDEVLGLDRDTGAAKKAVLTVTYGNLDYDPDAPDEGGDGVTTYISESFEPAAEFLTLGVEGLSWDSAGDEPLEAGEAPAMILRMVDWVYTVHRVIFIPAWVWTHPGTINSGAIKSWSLNKTFAAGTLLCGNPSMSREITSEGAQAWTITIRMTHRPSGWNKFPNPRAAGGLAFVDIYVNGSVKPFYVSTDFTQIAII